MIDPKASEAMISGSVMKKLKIPMYVPVFSGGSAPERIAYGIDRMLAQAIPTPAIEANRSHLS